MNTSFDSKGDLGAFIIAELNLRGVPLLAHPELPALPAVWRGVTVLMAGAPKEVAVVAQSCLLEDVLRFCFSLISPLRIERPFSHDNDMSFWFSLNGKQGNFLKTEAGLVVSFIAFGASLTVGKSEHGVFVGFAEQPQATI